ncbi:hypothetical protein CRE_28643 [Caenorhabditis remanei]|uniref:Uncharacterized protein n=2 Tax=Caenorhabditis remanei TaxID=31234 RepID=E3LNE7_CAERE|nr:hypothetical protein CRE_28643 [Caenorhabditis remanei]
MTTKPFLLWKLPHVARKQVLDYMDPMELIFLTFMSKHIKYSAFGLLEADKFSWTVMNNLKVIEVISKDRTNRKFKMNFQITQVPPNNKTIKLKNRKIPFKASKKTFNLKSEKNEEDNISILDDLTEHLLVIFKIAEYGLHSEFNLFDSPIFKNTKRFSELQLNNQDLTVEHTRTLLETMEIDFLTLYLTRPKIKKGPEDFQLKHNIMKLGNVDWLKFSSVLNMKCEELILGRMNHITQKDFSDFVRVWSEGGFENLTSFYVQVPHVWEQRDIDMSYLWRNEVYESFKSMDLTIVKATRNGDEKTIQRNDGKRAEILFKNFFKFKVL